LAPWGDLFAATVSDISLLHGPVWTVLMLSLFLTIGLGYALLIGAQHALLRISHRAAHNKEHVTFTELAFEMLHPRFGSMALLNLASKLLTVLILLLGGLQLNQLSVNQPLDLFFGTIFSLTIVSLCFAINTITMLALTELAEEHTTLRQALAFGLKAFKRDVLISIEFSALLFGFQLVSSVIFLGLVTLGTAIFAGLVSLAAELQSPLFTLGLAVSAILVGSTFAIGATGSIVTLTYSAWVEFAHVARRTPGRAKLARVVRRHFWV
jgi:CRISPR/Cas system-associated protein endoribonuclease Cas2